MSKVIDCATVPDKRQTVKTFKPDNRIIYSYTKKRQTIKPTIGFYYLVSFGFHGKDTFPRPMKLLSIDTLKIPGKPTKKQFKFESSEGIIVGSLGCMKSQCRKNGEAI